MSFILNRESSTSYKIYSIFNDYVEADHYIRFKLKFYAENFLSNLFESNKGIISYDHRHLYETKSASSIFIFPSYLLKHEIKLEIIDCRNVKLIATKLSYKMEGDKLVYTINNSKGENPHICIVS